MTLNELESEITLREAEGRDRMILSVSRPCEPRGRSIRVLPGVLGTLVGYAGGTVTVDVSVADLRRYLNHARSRMEHEP